jgi:hypothetical protein
VEYAYLMASLPRLELLGDLPLSSADLLRATDGVLSNDDAGDVRAILEDRHDEVRASDEVRGYLDAETQLRNALSRARASRAGVEASAAQRPHSGFQSRVEEVATRAMTVEDPLERELLLDRHRWSLLDEVAALPAFGRQAVFAYAFRLRLAEKWAALTEEAGLKVATQVVESNLLESGV